MSAISQSRGLRATVWLASTYICFLVASTAPWQQQPSADEAPSVTSGPSLAAPPFSGAGLRAGLGDRSISRAGVGEVAPFAATEARIAATARPYVGFAVEVDRPAQRLVEPYLESDAAADRSAQRAREAFKGILMKARIDVSREVLSDVERVAPVVAAAAADLAIRHVAAAVRSIDRVRVKRAIAAAQCPETRAAAKVMVAEIAADAIEHLVVRGVEAAVAHTVKVQTLRAVRHRISF